MNSVTIAILIVGAIAAASFASRLGDQIRRPYSAWVRDALLGAALLLALINPPWFPTQTELTVSTPGSRKTAEIHWSDSPDQLGHSSIAPGTVPAGTRSITLSGAGLPLATLAELRDLAIASLEPPSTDSAFIDLSFPARVDLGQPVTISGEVQGRSQKMQVRLERGVLLAESDTPEGRFSVSFLPRISGVLNLQLTAFDDGGSVTTDAVTLEVRNPEPVRVHMELSRPAFEANALRTWLIDHGAVGVIRTALAPGIERVERLEADDRYAEDMPPLDSLDLWIGDATSWLAWESVLGPAVARGLGVLILADQYDGSGAQPIALAPTRTQSAESVNEQLHASWFIASGKAMAIESAPRQAVGWIPRGQGRIAISTLTDSHRLLTGAAQGVYANLWAPIVNTVIRQQDRFVWHRHTDYAATPGMRTTTCIDDGELAAEPTPVVVLQRPTVAGLRCFDWWPRQGGWHRMLSTEGHEIDRLLVQNPDVLRGSRHHQRTMASQFEASLALPALTASDRSERRPHVWWWLFVIVAAALWTHEVAGRRQPVAKS